MANNPSDNNPQSNRTPLSVNDNPILFPKPFEGVTADPFAENALISSMGIRFFHYQAVSDPLHQVDSGGLRHSFDQESLQQFEDTDRFQRENGFIYFKRGIIHGVFSGNSKDLKYLPAGLYTDSGASLSLNRYYENSTDKIEVSENDKLIPCELPSEFFTTISHKFDHNASGIDRLQFKAVNVRYLIDSAGVMYEQDVDFVLDCGVVKWNNGPGVNRPGLDPLSGKGRVCGVRYTYKPFYYIKMIMHDIRIKPMLDPNTGEIRATAGPVLVNIVADWVYLDRRTASGNAIDAQLDAGDTDNTGPR